MARVDCFFFLTFIKESSPLTRFCNSLNERLVLKEMVINFLLLNFLLFTAQLSALLNRGNTELTK